MLFRSGFERAKEKIQSFVDAQTKLKPEDKNLLREILTGLIGKSVRELIRQLKNLKNLVRKNKNVTEDIEKLSANPFLLIALAPLIIIGILILINCGLFKPNYCRRWSNYKRYGMSGYN